MHLREYVRSDDVDLAIRVAIDSFISTQKYSVRQAVAKRFSKYVNMALDHFQLLYYALNTMVNEKVRLYQLQYKSMPSSAVVNVEDFERRVGDTNYL